MTDVMPRLATIAQWFFVLMVVYGALSLLANRLVYQPMKYPQGFWDVQRQLGIEDVWLTAADGVRIHAWWMRRPGALLATLFLHGNAGNVTHRYPRMQEVPAAGSSILVLDYRGYGRSEGRPTEQGLYRDADAGYEYLVKLGYRPENIVVHGESLGTAVAVDLASRKPCAGVVLEAPFTSSRDVAASILPAIGPMLIWGLDSRAKIARIRAPLFFMQGDQDEVIPPRFGQALFAAAREPKSMWVIQGAGHNDILETAGPQYRRRLQAFYESVAH